jgi:RNA polymerase sigma factor (sigma-70 family)
MRKTKRDRLIVDNMDKVCNMASGFRMPDLKDDMLSAGMEALVVSATRYKPGLAAFWTYAYKRVRGAMLDVIRQDRAAMMAVRIDDGLTVVDHPEGCNDHWQWFRRETIECGLNDLERFVVFHHAIENDSLKSISRGLDMDLEEVVRHYRTGGAKITIARGGMW